MNNANCGTVSNSLEYAQPLNNSYNTLIESGSIVLNNICNYRVYFPAGSKTGDIIYFRVNLNDRADVYYTISNSDLNASNIVSTGTCVKATKYSITYPQ